MWSRLRPEGCGCCGCGARRVRLESMPASDRDANSLAGSTRTSAPRSEDEGLGIGFRRLSASAMRVLRRRSFGADVSSESSGVWSWVSRTMRRSGRRRGRPVRSVSEGLSARRVPMPVRMASLLWRSCCTSARAASPVSQWGAVAVRCEGAGPVCRRRRARL